MKQNKRRNIWWIVCLLMCPCASAISVYPHAIDLVNYSSRLNNSTIHDIQPGEEGFVWFATDRGLSYYDGSRVRNFPLPNTRAVHCICRNTTDLLYFRYQQGGIGCFNKREERYLPVKIEAPFKQEQITGLYMIDKDAIYVGTTAGLYLVVVQQMGEGEEAHMLLTSQGEPLYKGSISHLRSDEKENLFFVVNKTQVIHYAIGTRITNEVGVEGNKNNEIVRLALQGNYVWMLRKWSDVAYYNFKSKTYRVLPDAGAAGRIKLSETNVTGVAYVGNGTYYLSTWTGLFCLKFNSERLEEASYTIDCLSSNGQLGNQMVENRMTCIFWNPEHHSLWMGTYGGGAVKMGFNPDLYTRVTQSLSLNPTGIEEDAKGYIWMSTSRQGVWRSTSADLSTATTLLPWNKGLQNEKECKLYKDKNGHFWLGGASNVVELIDPNTEQIHAYPLAPEGKPGFSATIKEFCLDSRDRLWVVTSEGVVLYDQKMEHCKLVLSPSAQLKEIHTIAEDKEGQIWIGTDTGIKRLEMKGDYATAEGNYEQEAGISPNAVYSIYVNSYNQIFASYQIEVLRIDSRTNEKVAFTLTNGLKNGHVYALIDDLNGNTWAGTNSGIITMRNDCSSFYNYSTSGFNSHVCRLRDGRLLWIDSRGLLYFDPREAKKKQPHNTLLVSELWVNGVPIAVGQKANGQQVLSLAPRYQDKFVFSAYNNDFSFYFSDRQYDMMQRKVAYRLLPDNEEWTITSLEEGVGFHRLDAGSYTLQVKLVYPDAGEGELLEIPIVVKDFWWYTNWAYLFYLLLLCGVFAGGYYWLKRCERNRQQPREQQQEAFEEQLNRLPTEQPQPTEVGENIDWLPKEEEEIDIVETEVTLRVTNQQEDTARKTVLIVEDYRDIRFYLKTLLENEYRVLLANNGEEGIILARKEIPDLIICDVMMPVKDGYQCCREVKEGLNTCHIPFIMLTAKVEDDDVVKGLDTGADDYMLKPFVGKILQAKVRSLIENRTSLKRMYSKLFIPPTDPDNTEEGMQETTEAVEVQDPFISSVVKIVEENMQEPDFNVKKLASELNMSQPTLYRKVKQCTDFTIIELIRGVRMRKAAVLLKQKQYAVQEVAEMVGYNDIPTFRKHFVDAYGSTPSTYASSEEKQEKNKK